MPSKSLQKHYFGLLKRYWAALKVPDDEREQIRKELQSGRSLKDIPAEELTQICRDLERQMGIEEDPDKMRKKIIGLLAQSGMRKGDKPDMKAIYPYVLKMGYLKKGLNDYTLQELPKLVTQMARLAAYRQTKNLKINEHQTGTRQKESSPKVSSDQIRSV